MAQSVEARLRRRMVNLSRKQTVTVDDATQALEAMGKIPDPYVVRQVLSKPVFSPVGWARTDKPSRHGRPVRSWKVR